MRRSLRRAFLMGVVAGVIAALWRGARRPHPTPGPLDAPTPALIPPAWVAPTEGGCPDGYPVKLKEASGIFHVPGGLSYERTRPDRCYRSAEAAVADGFRPAKR